MRRLRPSVRGLLLAFEIVGVVFVGIGAPRAALRNRRVDVRSGQAELRGSVGLALRDWTGACRQEFTQRREACNEFGGVVEFARCDLQVRRALGVAYQFSYPAGLIAVEIDDGVERIDTGEVARL